MKKITSFFFLFKFFKSIKKVVFKNLLNDLLTNTLCKILSIYLEMYELDSVILSII